MKVLAISDTHGKHRQLTQLPPADLIIHAGDFCTVGTVDEAMDFLEWMVDLPYPHKVFIAGNHDTPLIGGSIQGLPKNCHFLQHRSVTIEGIKVLGIPFFLESRADQVVKTLYEEDVDILVTHQPPYGVLDIYEPYGHYGNKMIEEVVKATRPRYHLFGHMHENYGHAEVEGIHFYNCALQGRQNLEILENKPFLFEILPKQT